MLERLSVVVRHVVQEDAVPRITEQITIVTSFLTHLSFSKAAILPAPHIARKPRSNSWRKADCQPLGRLLGELYRLATISDPANWHRLHPS